MVGTTALIIASIVGSIIAAGAGTASAAINYNAQKEVNKTNVQLQNSANQANYQAAALNNQTQLDIAKHAHQYEMEDLKAAGLNPVLTATGGQGASIGALSMPNAQAARVGAPQLDLSGLSNAINSMSHLMLISKLSEDRNDTLNGLYRRKAESLGSKAVAQTAVNSAKSMIPKIIKARGGKLTDAQYKKILKDLGY